MVFLNKNPSLLSIKIRKLKIQSSEKYFDIMKPLKDSNSRLKGEKKGGENKKKVRNKIGETAERIGIKTS